MAWYKIGGSSAATYPSGFIGSYEVDPAVRPDGSGLVLGDSYYNSATNTVYILVRDDLWSSFSPSGAYFVGSVVDDPGTRPDGSALQNGDYIYSIRKKTLKVFFSNSKSWLEIQGAGTVYCGARETSPTLRPSADPLQEGDYYYNTAQSQAYFLFGNSWVGTAGGSSVFCGQSSVNPEARPDGAALGDGDYYYNINTRQISIYSEGIWVSRPDSVVFCGSLGSAPGTRPDGSALADGDTYYNYNSSEFSIYTGQWRSIAKGGGGGGNGAGVAYVGEFISPPATRHDGSPLEEGDFCFNPASSSIMVYSNTEWVMARSIGSVHCGVLKTPPLLRPDGTSLKQGDTYQPENRSTVSFLDRNDLWSDITADGTEYLGRTTGTPTYRLDGSNIKDGDYYYNTSNNLILFKDSLSQTWIEANIRNSRYLGEYFAAPNKRTTGDRLFSGDYYYSLDINLFRIWAKNTWITLSKSPEFQGNLSSFPTKRVDSSPLIMGDSLFYTLDKNYYMFLSRDEDDKDTWATLSSVLPPAYLGELDAAPSLRPDGSSLVYLDTYSKAAQYYYYAGNHWQQIGPSPAAMHLGELTAAPSLRPDGSSLVHGDTYSSTGMYYTYLSEASVKKWLQVGTNPVAKYIGEYGIEPTARDDGSKLEYGDIYSNSGDHFLYAGASSLKKWIPLAGSGGGGTSSGSQFLGDFDLAPTKRSGGGAIISGDYYYNKNTMTIMVWVVDTWRRTGGSAFLGLVNENTYSRAFVPPSPSTMAVPKFEQGNTILRIGKQSVSNNQFIYSSGAWTPTGPQYMGVVPTNNSGVDLSACAPGDYYFDQATGTTMLLKQVNYAYLADTPATYSFSFGETLPDPLAAAWDTFAKTTPPYISVNFQVYFLATIANSTTKKWSSLNPKESCWIPQPSGNPRRADLTTAFAHDYYYDMSSKRLLRVSGEEIKTDIAPSVTVPSAVGLPDDTSFYKIGSVGDGIQYSYAGQWWPYSSKAPKFFTTLVSQLSRPNGSQPVVGDIRVTGNSTAISLQRYRVSKVDWGTFAQSSATPIFLGFYAYTTQFPANTRPNSTTPLVDGDHLYCVKDPNNPWGNPGTEMRYTAYRGVMIPTSTLYFGDYDVGQRTIPNGIRPNGYPAIIGDWWTFYNAPFEPFRGMSIYTQVSATSTLLPYTFAAV